MGETLGRALATPAVKGMGRPAFISPYRSAAYSMTIWEAELVAAVGRKIIGWFLVGVRFSFP